MEMLSGAEMVVRALEDEGVEYLFGYPGGSVLDIYDALFENSKIEHVLVRHEQAAIHMADGFARSTGKVGAALVTSGPGATNCITGIATAYMDSIPMVILSGQVPTTLIGDDAFQEVDMIGVSRPVVKHSFLCKTAAEIPMAIKKAFYIASTGRPGPVVVDLPKDVQNPKEKFPYEYPKSVSLRSYNPSKAGHKGQIKRAVKMLAEAKKPVLYVGGGAVLSNGKEQVRRLAELFSLPVTSTLMGLGAFPGTHSQFVGMLGMHGTFEANKSMHNADLILAVGARFDDRVTNNVAKFCPHAKIIHIDIDPTSISKTIQVDVPIVGAVDTVLDQMLEAVEELAIEIDDGALADWWEQIDGWRAKRCLSYQKSDSIIKPQQVIETLYKVTEGKAYVASDVGQHQMFAALYYPFAKPRQWINSGGLGTMGFGIPAAMGAQFANPDAVVCCVTGDGSVQMNIQELSTCLQYNTPIKVLSLNNRYLGMVRQWQEIEYSGRYSHSYMDSLPDFVKLAEAYGHVGMLIEDPKDIEPALREARKLKDRTVFLDFRTDPTENVFPMVQAGKGITEMLLGSEDL